METPPSWWRIATTCKSGCIIRIMAGAEGEHVAEAALVDDGHGGVEREGAAQFVDVAVQGVAVAYGKNMAGNVMAKRQKGRWEFGS